MVDIYQYNDWLWSENIEQLNISIEINKKIQIKDYKSEINNYKNRFIIINAFFIPFEYLDILLNKNIEIFIRINQCRFLINDNSTWNDTIHNSCNTNESKTLNIQYAQCDFLPKLVFQKKNQFFFKIFLDRYLMIQIIIFKSMIIQRISLIFMLFYLLINSNQLKQQQRQQQLEFQIIIYYLMNIIKKLYQLYQS
jgi:hypothetical protein